MSKRREVIPCNYYLYSYSLFRIAGKGPAALKRSCIREIGFSDETYNFNLQTKRRNEGKLNIRVQFKDGKPKVILVKKSEYKVAMFDIICLHRSVQDLLVCACACMSLLSNA